ncbi:MAG: LysE/ArgO family amino acid transporter [Propionibacteriaceae bacterium]|nr:LysE/ArgO family amino acid transporter [Propionibacteriaceae bacterium]
MGVILAAVLAGVGAGLSLIIAIGAQNAYVLRQGLRGEHVFGVVAICAGSDIVLITAGTLGIDLISGLGSWALPVITGIGIGFLVVYGFLALRRALHPKTLVSDDTQSPGATLWPVLLTACALTWLNPHVYLDTVVLLGSLAVGHQPNQWWFAVGAMVASCLWFPVLGYGARLLRPFFASARAWRILDIIIAVVMWGIAASLVVSSL